MTEFMKLFQRLWGIVIIWLVVISLIPPTLAAMSRWFPANIHPYLPYLLLGFAILVLALWMRVPVFRGLWFIISGIFSLIWNLLLGLRNIGSPIQRGARWMNGFERFFLLNRATHKGFLVDGRINGLRLSEKNSHKSVLALGGMGAGKSSTYVIPNAFELDNCSMVFTDTSGELYQQTSGYLARKGFEIQVFNLQDLDRSLAYNPLSNLSSFTDVHKTAQLLVNSAIKDSDGFWNEGAVRIIRIIIQCLINRGDPEFINLANVKFLLNNFDCHIAPAGKSQFDRFVVESTLNDPSTYQDYKGFTAGNEKTMLSFLSTADTALAALGNPEIARLTAQNQFDFAALKQRKIALFVIVNQKDMGFYSFLLNLFYTDLFNHLISDLSASKLPVYLLLDEFGHLTIPDFEVFATTARKYKVGFFLFLQSFSQLVSRYGPHNASTILNGLQTEIYLPGIGLDAAQELQRKLGKVYSQSSGNAHEQARNLMDEADLIRLESDTALLLHANKKPVKLSTKPFFKQRRFARYAKIPPRTLPHITANFPPSIDLSLFRESTTPPPPPPDNQAAENQS